MTTEVSDDDFQEILAQTRHFVRTAVVPREQEILADDRVPDDLREQAKKMGLFGYAIPREWGGLGLNLVCLGHITAHRERDSILGVAAELLGRRLRRAEIQIAQHHPRAL